MLLGIPGSLTLGVCLSRSPPAGVFPCTELPLSGFSLLGVCDNVLLKGITAKSSCCRSYIHPTSTVPYLPIVDF